MKKSKWLYFGLLLTILTLLFTGCQSDDSVDASEDDEEIVEEVAEDNKEDIEKESTDTDEKQILNVSLRAEPDSLDVAKASDAYSAEVLYQAIETLTRVEVDENGESIIAPAAATDWEVTEDGLEWTFHLREATWSDGEELLASHYEYGIKRILDPETASPISSLLKHIKNAEKAVEGEVDLDEVGVKATDDKTLVFTLEYPVPYFLYLTSGREMQPQREDIIEEFGDSYGTEADKMVFCGPFIVEDWIHNSEIILSKNENYWDKDNVELDQLVMKIISEESALIGEFQNENIDITEVDTAEWVEALDNEDIYDKSVKVLSRTSYVFFNQEIELFSNAKVRQAFSVALDREVLQDGIYQGLEEAAYGWIAPPIESDGENFREKAGEPVKELLDENPDPQSLLIEGLEELGLDTDPSSHTVTIMVPDTARSEMSEYLQQLYMQELGINIELDATEWPVFQERNRQLDYEMGFKSWGGGHNDPTAFLDLWITGTKIVPIAWSNEEYDSLVKEAAQSTDASLRFENFKEAERILIKEDCAIAPYLYATSHIYKQPYVKGIMEPDFGARVLKYASIEK